MGSDQSVQQQNAEKQKLDQQKREHDLKIQLMKAEMEAKQKKIEYDHKLQLLKAENDAKLKTIQNQQIQTPIKQPWTHETVIKSGTQELSVRSKNVPGINQISHSVRSVPLNPVQGFANAGPSAPPQPNVMTSPLQTQRTPLYPVLDFANAGPSAPPQPNVMTSPLQTQRSPQHAGTQKNNLSCVTCNGALGLLIYYCVNDHNSCRNCHLKYQRCGVCRQMITQRRNEPLEDEVAQNAYDYLAKHEEKIRNRPRDKSVNRNKYKDLHITCRGQTCNWSGTLETLKTHYEENHNEKIVRVNSEISIPINVDLSTPFLLTIGTFTFFFYVKVVEDKLYLIVQNIGTIFAYLWDYEFHIYNKHQPRRKYQFSNVCHSSSVSVEKIIQEQSCSVLPISGYVNNFLTNGILTLKVFIRRVPLSS